MDGGKDQQQKVQGAKTWVHKTRTWLYQARATFAGPESQDLSPSEPWHPCHLVKSTVNGLPKMKEQRLRQQLKVAQWVGRHRGSELSDTKPESTNGHKGRKSSSLGGHHPASVPVATGVSMPAPVWGLSSHLLPRTP